ncbi:hypothetical protein CAI21_07945 [Alkalilimnicola ehrlichii]|uniref:Sulfotransferase family protein n=1 Tax=Alkalilimnicola ehrlichii TaxID=351052 RepID=A0A3E0WWT7_9GAMM|nr:sulfotransferase [Alkalilimnicola ehrlichii]RFA30122.1 hypothetical protein CAI21_07945 [Alkalilimnicola ehrlichii]RFA37470.1 hypothetical protein CAL65_09295 [Alkalilimnicola ehrlichii]
MHIASKVKVRNEHNQRQRLFLLGCSRSGTSLIQHRLANHSLIYSLPETDFFGRLMGNAMWRWVATHGWVRRRSATRALEKLGTVAGGTPQHIGTDRHFVATKECVAAFIETLEQATSTTEKRIWLEKTPKHYRYIEQIEKYIPSSSFIHVVRDGKAVVASIQSRARKFSDEFGHQSNPRYAVKLWNRAVQVALKRVGMQTDIAVFYEEFATEPKQALQNLCHWIGVEYEPAMLSVNEKTSGIRTSNEQWKDGVTRDIKIAPSQFTELFSKREQRRISKALDYHSYEKLRRAVCAAEKT